MRPTFMLAAMLAVCATPAWATERLALVVGHNLGAMGESPLSFAERDAERMRDVLVGLSPSGDESDVRLLARPSVADLDAALADLQQRAEALAAAGSPATVLFYYAGHGDSGSLHLGRETVDRESLLATLRAIPAAFRLVVLDACRTPEQLRGISAGSSFEVGTLPISAAEGTVVITSTREGEPAIESPILGGAVFTHYWVSALRGAADFDQNGQVTLTEAYTYAYRETVRHSAGTSAAVQRPGFEYQLQGVGELALSAILEADASLVIPPGPEAHVLVYSQPSGTVVAEAVASTEADVVLAVPSGRLYIQRRLEDVLEVTEVNLPYGGAHRLAESDFESRPYAEVALLGGAYDLHPWSVAVSGGLGGDWVDGTGTGTWHGRFSAYFARGRIGLVASSAVAVGSTYAVGLLSNDHETVSLTGGGFADLGVGPLWLRGEAGLGVLMLNQHRIRTDAERLATAGLPTGQDDRLTVAPMLEIGVRLLIPLSGPLSLAATSHGSVALASSADGALDWLTLSVGLGAHLRF